MINKPMLPYHDNNDEFKKSGMKGQFVDNMCGNCLLVYELQITMNVLLFIKVYHFVFLYCL